MFYNLLSFVDNSNIILGPIEDQVGVEQGGVTSSELFLLQGSKEGITMQKSGFGIDLGGVSVAAISQADDTCLLSYTVDGLQSLATIAYNHTDSHCVKLVPKSHTFCPLFKRGTHFRAYQVPQSRLVLLPYLCPPPVSTWE